MRHQNAPEKTPTTSKADGLFQAISKADKPPKEKPAKPIFPVIGMAIFFLAKGKSSLMIKSVYKLAFAPRPLKSATPATPYSSKRSSDALMATTINL
ncbi:hypothetical protein D3C73_1257650 [compost metagenome]